MSPSPRAHRIGAAAGQAQLRPRHPRKPVALGRGEHGLEAQARGILELGARRRPPSRLGHPPGEGVAVLLELVEPQGPRSRPDGRRRRNAFVPGVGGELCIEAGDLSAQGAARGDGVGRADVEELPGGGDGHVSLRSVLVDWPPRTAGSPACQ